MNVAVCSPPSSARLQIISEEETCFLLICVLHSVKVFDSMCCLKKMEYFSPGIYV